MKPCLFCLSLVGCFLLACTSRPPAAMEKPVPRSNLDTVLPKMGRVLSRPASIKEIDATLKRVFGDVIVAEHADRSFLTGDFNGDGSPDLAAIVMPQRTKLGMINDELANWTVQDASHFFSPPAGRRVAFLEKQSPARVHAGEPLLAIVHGVGHEGWRDPRARQAYLVRHAGFGRLRAVPAAGHVQNASPLIGNADLIYEGPADQGFLFWTGSQYAWSSAMNKSANSEKHE